MKSRDLFALAVRIAGLVSLMYLLATAVLFFAAGMALAFVIKTILWFLLSLWLIRGAPQLVRFAYPGEQ
jgi:hypothetical protein